MKEETMEYCFGRLKMRILDSLKQTDLETIFETLRSIKGPTLVSGVGGSSVVATYFAKVLNRKNGIIAEAVFPRNLLSKDLSAYENVIACSYSGNNIGVRASFENPLQHYLFSANTKENVIPLQYCMCEEEISFVSVAATLLPMAILFLYATDNNMTLLEEILTQEYTFEHLAEKEIYEIIYGEKNSTAAILLESTIVEGGLGAAVLHEKYNYCHGRCQLHSLRDSALIYLEEKSELDTLMKREFASFYPDRVILESRYEDEIVSDFDLSLRALLLCRRIAEEKGRDLCLKRVKEISEILYTYQGGI